VGAAAYIIVLAFGISGLIGYAIGTTKGRGGLGFVLGLLFGFIGWIIAALLGPSTDFEARRAVAIADAVNARPMDGTGAPGATRPCPWCAEPIRPQAKVCRFCQHEVEPIEQDAVQTARSSANTPPAPFRICVNCGSEFTTAFTGDSCLDCGGVLRDATR
jgi:hypothetical protein